MNMFTSTIIDTFPFLNLTQQDPVYPDPAGVFCLLVYGHLHSGGSAVTS